MPPLIDSTSLIAEARALRMGYAGNSQKPDSEQIICAPWTERDIGDIYYIRDKLDWLQDEIKSGMPLTEERHGLAIRNIVALNRALTRKERMHRAKSNPYHKPAGSSEGGQFDFAPGNGGGGTGISAGNQPASGTTPAGISRHVPTIPSTTHKPLHNPRDWSDYHTIQSQTPSLSHNEKTVYANFFMMEGGFQSDGHTYAGITPQALRDAKRNPKLSGPLRDIAAPNDLNKHKELLPLIYQSHLQDALSGAGGIDALDKVGNDHAMQAMGDAILRMGGTAGGKAISNAVVATDPSLAGKLGTPGRLGPVTLQAYSRLARSPDTLEELLHNLAAERNKKYPHENPRNEHFVFEGKR